MTPAKVEALGFSPAEMRNLLAGFAEETVVIGSRAELGSRHRSPIVDWDGGNGVAFGSQAPDISAIRPRLRSGRPRGLRAGHASDNGPFRHPEPSARADETDVDATPGRHGCGCRMTV